MIEVKARSIVISNGRSGFKLRRHILKERNGIANPVKAMWAKQSDIVTVKTTKLALESGTVPAEWKEPWERMIREFVRDTITQEWIKSLSVGGEDIADKINRLQRKQFDFDSTMTRVKAWVDNEGGSLIVDLTTAQMNSTHALLQNQIAMQVTSPYVLQQRIKPMVGLTQKETMAVSRFMAALTEEGVSADIINRQVARYAAFLHKNRALRIARTEISNSYNFGQMNAMRQATAEGWIPGTPEKAWMAGGINPCDICLDNEAAGYIGLDAAFPSGDDHPTTHPNDECAVGYRVRR
jgi:hypothetical protein